MRAVTRRSQPCIPLVKGDISIVAIGFYLIWVGNLPKLAMDPVFPARRYCMVLALVRGRDTEMFSFQEMWGPFLIGQSCRLSDAIKMMVLHPYARTSSWVPWAKGADYNIVDAELLPVVNIRSEDTLKEL